MTHPSVHMLDRVPQNKFRFKTPTHWQAADLPLYTGAPKWPVNIFAVANAPGLDVLRKGRSGRDFRAAFCKATEEVSGNHYHNNRIYNSKIGPVGTPPTPRKLAELTAPNNLLAPPAAAHQLPNLELGPPTKALTQNAALAFPANAPLAADPKKGIYTDGSFLKGSDRAGAAI